MFLHIFIERIFNKNLPNRVNIFSVLSGHPGKKQKEDIKIGILCFFHIRKQINKQTYKNAKTILNKLNLWKIAL